MAAIGNPPAVRAAEQLLTLDPEGSEVRFTLGATMHKVEGSVRVASGELRFDPAGGPMTGEIVVDATSAETGSEGRDKDMHRKVLESDEYGTFVFRPTELAGTVNSAGPSEVELRGELEIHGSAHPVTLPAQVSVQGSTLTGTATFEVPYVAWGMKDPSKFVLRVEKVVEVEIRLTGTVRAAPAAP